MLRELVQFLPTTHDIMLMIRDIGTSSGRWWERARIPTHYADGTAEAVVSSALRPGPSSSGARGFLIHRLPGPAQGESESGDLSWVLKRAEVSFLLLCPKSDRRSDIFTFVCDKGFSCGLGVYNEKELGIFSFCNCRHEKDISALVIPR